jgi:crossover junction endodeoxyribonuclease RusA
MTDRKKKKTVTFTVDSRPVPKGRPRMTRYGRVFTPKRTLDAEALVAAAYPRRRGKFKGTVSVKMRFTIDGTEITIADYVDTESRLKGDIDNYAKTILDGLNGVAWGDDKQVVYIEAEKA